MAGIKPAIFLIIKLIEFVIRPTCFTLKRHLIISSKLNTTTKHADKEANRNNLSAIEYCYLF